jgi:hypothetical protein
LRALARLRPGYVASQQAAAKAFWRTQATDCPNAPRIYAAADDVTQLRHVLEFGASRGGNLTYFLDRHPELRATAIDVNPIVETPAATYGDRYRAIVGDEAVLAAIPDRSVDLAFTISVLDHIPNKRTVEQVLDDLLRISARVVLLEPWIEGVEGDVSGRTRAQVKPGLDRPHKAFAAFSYLWKYDRLLTDRGVRWTKQPMPLHTASLGPFYHLYVIG